MQEDKTVLQNRVQLAGWQDGMNERKREWVVHPYSMLIRFGFAARVMPDLRFVQSTVPPRLRLPTTGRFDTRGIRLEAYWDGKGILTMDLQTSTKVAHYNDRPNTGYQQEEQGDGRCKSFRTNRAKYERRTYQTQSMTCKPL